MTALMPQACARCWRRKQRCDRELPECRKCREAGSTCLQRRMGVLLDPSQPEPVSYIEGLQERVRQLELRTAKTQESSDSTAESQARSSSQPSGLPGGGDGEQVLDLGQAASLETTKHVMDYLPLSAMAEPRDRQQISRQQYSFETFLGAAVSVSGADVTRSNTSNTPLSRSIEDFHREVLPAGLRLSRLATETSVHYYLSVCDVMCPFLNREAFLADYDTLMEKLERGSTQEVANGWPHDLFLIYISVATGILLSPEYRYKEGFAVKLAQEALRLLPLVLKTLDNASVVRALIALAVFSMYNPLGGSPWHLVGLALARSMSAGMHTSEVSDLSSTDSAARENSRLFWSLYTLDATLSSALNRPFCLQDREITAPMPLYSNKPPVDNRDTFLFHAVQYAHLLHEIRHKASMGTVFHLANFSHWKETTAERLHLPTESQMKDLVSQSIASSSCKLILQILSCSAPFQRDRLTHLHATADVELESLVTTYKRVADTQSRVLTAFDGLDILSICIYVVERHDNKSWPWRLHTDPVVRSGLGLLSTISERFPGVKQWSEMLWLFIDLASNDGSNVEADVLRLTERYHDSGTSLPASRFDQMRAILVGRSENRATDDWARTGHGMLP